MNKQPTSSTTATAIVQTSFHSEDTEQESIKPLPKRARKLPAKLCDGQSILDEYVAFQTSTTTASSGPADDLKVSFFFAFIDTLTSTLDERFGKTTCNVLTWMSAFSAKKWKEPSQQTIDDITNLCVTYGVSHDAVIQYKLFSANQGRASSDSFKDLLKYMFENDFHNLYPSLFQLVKICATISITSSECERTNSKVARVKSAVRCSMTDDRLEHLVLINVEQDIATNLGLSLLVDVFKLAGPDSERRVKL